MESELAKGDVQLSADLPSPFGTVPCDRHALALEVCHLVAVAAIEHGRFAAYVQSSGILQVQALFSSAGVCVPNS